MHGRLEFFDMMGYHLANVGKGILYTKIWNTHNYFRSTVPIQTTGRKVLGWVVTGRDGNSRGVHWDGLEWIEMAMPHQP